MQLFDRILSVVVAAEATKVVERIGRLQSSICDLLPSWQVWVDVLEFKATDASLRQELHGNSGVHVFHCAETVLPVVQSRNICQRHLSSVMQARGGVGLVLDDDLVWTLSESNFESLLVALISEGSDMAILGIDGDPPVPREYVRASPLLDYLFHVADSDSPIKLNSYLSSIKLVSIEPFELHHDYYTFTNDGFSRVPFECGYQDFFRRLSDGKVTTRPVRTYSALEPVSLGVRGGATLIINVAVLGVLNESVSLDNWVSRRSDMVMADRVLELGYRIHSVPVVLTHERQCNFDTDSPDKLVTDVLGAAYVEFNRGGGSTIELGIKRSVKTRQIIAQTSKMLDICLGLDTVLPEDKIIINGMITSNERAISALTVFERRLLSQPLSLYPSYPADGLDATVG